MFYLPRCFFFLKDSYIGSLTKANAKQNYQKFWNIYQKNPESSVPTFPKKNYTWFYQTNCRYNDKDNFSLTNGIVRFLDKKHLKVPKIGRIRFNKSQKVLLDKPYCIRIGTVIVRRDNPDCFFISLQLGPDHLFVKGLKKQIRKSVLI